MPGCGSHSVVGKGVPFLHLLTECPVTLALPLAGLESRFSIRGAGCAEPEEECWARAGASQRPTHPNACQRGALIQAGAGPRTLCLLSDPRGGEDHQLGHCTGKSGEKALSSPDQGQKMRKKSPPHWKGLR